MEPTHASFDAATLNCSQDCSTSFAGLLAGPSLICTSGSFSINNLPSGFTTTWSTSSPPDLSINSTTGTATRQNNFYGSVKVMADITGNCGTVKTSSLTHIGNPSWKAGNYNGTPVDLTGSTPNSFPVSSWNTVNVSAETTSSSHSGHINFSISGNQFAVNTTVVNDSTFNFLTKYSNNQFLVNFTANNACGSTGGSIYFCNGNCTQIQFVTINHGKSLTVFPNPASSSITVQVVDSTSTETVLKQPYQLNLMNRFAQTVYSVQSSDKSLQIPIGALPEDIYYLNVYFDGVLLKEQVEVKR